MSLIINKNSTNYVGLTLKEKTTISPVYYLFEFIHTISNSKDYCICTELSESDKIDRCNKFLITEKPSPVNTSGEISLINGDYVYNVYEQSNLVNLSPVGLTIVEKGFASCIDSETNLNKEYEGGILSNKVYNG